MLLGAVAGALEMKKQLDRIEAEYRTVQARLAAAEGRAAPAVAPLSEHQQQPLPMDVDALPPLDTKHEPAM